MEVFTNHREDDDEDPTELDGRANDFDFSKDVYAKDVDEDDDEPENADPGCRGDFVRPEVEHGIYGLKFVGDGYDVAEPVRPPQRKGGGGTYKLAGLSRPVNGLFLGVLLVELTH